MGWVEKAVKVGYSHCRCGNNLDGVKRLGEISRSEARRFAPLARILPLAYVERAAHMGDTW